MFRYLDKFLAGGVDGLLRREYEGGKEPTLAGADHTAFMEQLRQGKFRRAKEAQAWIKQRTKRTLALCSVYTLLGKVGAGLKVPRKIHAKKDAVSKLAGRVCEVRFHATVTGRSATFGMQRVLTFTHRYRYGACFLPCSSKHPD